MLQIKKMHSKTMKPPTVLIFKHCKNGMFSKSCR